MTYWYNSVVCSTNLYFSPGIFSPNCFKFHSQKLYITMMALRSICYSVNLHFLLPSSFSNTQGCQLSKIGSSKHPTSAVPFSLTIQQQDACHPHNKNGLYIVLHWDFQPIDADHFSEAPTFSLSCLPIIKSSTHSLWSILSRLFVSLPNRIEYSHR